MLGGVVVAKADVRLLHDAHGDTTTSHLALTEPPRLWSRNRRTLTLSRRRNPFKDLSKALRLLPNNGNYPPWLSTAVVPPSTVPRAVRLD